MNRKEVFAANFLMGPHTLARLTATAPLYGDDKPVLEYQTARNIYLPSRFHQLIEKNLEGPEAIFAQKISLVTGGKIAKIREETVHEMLAEKK